MKTLSKALALIIVLVSIQCSQDDPKPVLTAEFNVEYIPEFQNTIYPSMIFGLTEIEKQQGEAMEYFKITVAPNISTDVKLVIEESKLNFETVITESHVVGETKIIPSIKWKYDDLKHLSQPGNVDLTFVAYGDGGKEIGRENLKLSYRSINECIIYANVHGEFIAMPFMFAAYVNEDSDIIDPFLQEVLTSTDIVGAFTGYQGTELDVDKQVAAIFYTLRSRGTKYSSITATSNSNSQVISQYIRFSDEVLNNTQANCADGTVFFCSVLKKIDIHTLMIFVPGHVYLGYYADDAKTKLRLLETTMVGDLSTDFDDAISAQISSFNSNLEKFNNSSYTDGYFFLDIDNTRKIIKPIGR